MKKQLRLSGVKGLLCGAAALALAACSSPQHHSWNEGINIIPVPAEMTGKCLIEK